MANVKISGLPTASTPLTGAELVPVVQSGVTSQTTVDNLLNPLAETNGSSLVAYLPSGTNAVATTVQAKLREIVNVDDFIPAGTNTATTNCQAYIQAALDYAATIKTSITFCKGTYKCNSGLTFYPNTVAIQGNGAILDFSAMTTGYAISFSQSSLDANARNSLNKAHPIDSLYLTGPGGTVSVTAVKAMDQNPISGGYWLSGVTFRNCSFVNFKRDVEFNSGSFLFTFIACSFQITGGSGYDYSIYQPSGGSNYGENNEFIACFFGKSGSRLLHNENPNSATYFYGCSADYMSSVIYANGGTIYWNGYVESNTDTDYWFTVIGANTVLKIDGQITVMANKSAYEIFNCDSSVITGGLVLEANIEFATSSITYTPPSRNLVAGTGRTICQFIGTGQATVHPAIGGGLNFLANGGFESGTLNDWTLTGTIPPARSTVQAHSGTYSLAFPGAAGNTPAAQRDFPCLPGQMFTGGLWYYCNNISGTSGTFYISYAFLDKNNNTITGAAPLAVTTDQGTSWKYVSFNSQIAAPAGTVNVRLNVNIFGTASGSPVAYIDDVTVAVA